MIQTTAAHTETPTAEKPLVWPLIVLLAAIFFLAGHNVQISRLAACTVAADDAGLAAAGGDLARQAAFCSLGLLGLVLLVCSAGRPMPVPSGLAWLMHGLSSEAS